MTTVTTTYKHSNSPNNRHAHNINSQLNTEFQQIIRVNVAWTLLLKKIKKNIYDNN